MNSLERILASLSGKFADRPAVSMTLSLYGARLTNCPLSKYYTDPASYVAGQRVVKEKFTPDLLFAPFVLSAEGEAFGSKVTFFDNHPPNVIKHAANSAKEALFLSPPDINKSHRLLYIREAIKILSSIYGKDTPIAGIAVGPADLPSLIIGIDAWLEALLFDINTARKLLDMTASYFVKWANCLLDDGANFIAIPSVFCNPRIITPKIIEKIILPVYKKAFSQIKGPVVIHHGANKITPFLNYYQSLPNVVAFVLDPQDKFSVAREIVGREKLLMGNINELALSRITPEKIRISCEKILKERSNDPFFILATSGADIQYDTPEENILAIREAIENFKK